MNFTSRWVNNSLFGVKLIILDKESSNRLQCRSIIYVDGCFDGDTVGDICLSSLVTGPDVEQDIFTSRHNANIEDVSVQDSIFIC